MKQHVPMSVFCDGAVTEPRLSHPEGVAVDAEGNIWCGGDQGQIYRITADGLHRDLVATTGGFCLGMAFDSHGDLFVCDLKYAAVFKLEIRTGTLSMFAFLVPIFGIALSARLFGEALNPGLFAGAALVLSGVFVVIRLGQSGAD